MTENVFFFQNMIFLILGKKIYMEVVIRNKIHKLAWLYIFLC